ncbi:hypothetical protein LY76DRAFT_9888 [Colletotrichum caudatum]|nr:hypothetical protein LY76DRAFT_9888 [Colletotrichum caudatum]
MSNSDEAGGIQCLKSHESQPRWSHGMPARPRCDLQTERGVGSDQANKACTPTYLYLRSTYRLSTLPEPTLPGRQRETQCLLAFFLSFLLPWPQVGEKARTCMSRAGKAENPGEVPRLREGSRGTLLCTDHFPGLEGGAWYPIPVGEIAVKFASANELQAPFSLPSRRSDAKASSG